MVQNGSKWIKMDQNGSKWIKMDQIRTRNGNKKWRNLCLIEEKMKQKSSYKRLKWINMDIELT